MLKSVFYLWKAYKKRHPNGSVKKLKKLIFDKRTKMNTIKKFEKAFHTAYLKQFDLPYTKANAEEYLSDGDLKLLYQNDNYYVVLNIVDDTSFQGEYLNIINKKTYELECVEIA